MGGACSPGLAWARPAKAAVSTTADLVVLHERIGNVRAMIVGDARRGTLHILHQPIKIIAGTGDADHADGCAVPQFCRIEFGDRNVKTGAQPVFQAAHNLAPIFDRLCRFDVEFEGEKSDHAVVSG
jgi:hypothetical protein